MTQDNHTLIKPSYLMEELTRLQKQGFGDSKVYCSNIYDTYGALKEITCFEGRILFGLVGIFESNPEECIDIDGAITQLRKAMNTSSEDAILTCDGEMWLDIHSVKVPTERGEDLDLTSYDNALY